MLCIAIVDNHPILRKGLAEILREISTVAKVYEAANGKELMNIFSLPEQYPKPCLVLLDVVMPEMDGYATLKWLKQEHPHVKVIVVTIMADKEVKAAMFALKADAFIPKEEALEVIKNEITYLAAGQLGNNKQNANNPLPCLTYKEMELLQMLASDSTYKEIADILCVSESTIDSHRNNLFKKFNTKSRTALVLRGIENGLIKVKEKKLDEI